MAQARIDTLVGTKASLTASNSLEVLTFKQKAQKSSVQAPRVTPKSWTREISTFCAYLSFYWPKG